MLDNKKMSIWVAIPTKEKMAIKVPSPKTQIEICPAAASEGADRPLAGQQP